MVKKMLPNFEILFDKNRLQQQDGIARERAHDFILQGVPNRQECDLLANLLRKHTPELDQFPYLFLFEWVPSTMMGQGDAVFANAQGGLVVVEAKAKTAKAHVTRQSLFYRERLVEEYPEAAVSAAILTLDGFDWIQRASEKSGFQPVVSSTAMAKETPIAKEVETEEDTASQMVERDSVSKQFAMLVPSRIDQLESMVVEREIKPLLRFYGLRMSGRKSEMIERIYEHELTAGIAGGF